MITRSFIVACLESYEMAEKQIRHMAAILPDTWEMIFVDDGSTPEISIPAERPSNFVHLNTHEVRQPGEWTQKAAINKAVSLAKGCYIVKSDIDHVFTPDAIAACEAFSGAMMLFRRKAGWLSPKLEIHPVDHKVNPVTDDVFLMRRDLFGAGYPEHSLRSYGHAGKAFWHLSRRPEAQPIAGADIWVVPPTHEQYHGLERVL